MAKLILTTTNNKEEAKAIATKLLESRTAACVQIMPIESLYRWDAKIQESAEYLLFIKTQENHFATVQEQILALHSYQVPEIIQLPIEKGLPAYIEWLEEETN